MNAQSPSYGGGYQMPLTYNSKWYSILILDVRSNSTKIAHLILFWAHLRGCVGVHNIVFKECITCSIHCVLACFTDVYVPLNHKAYAFTCISIVHLGPPHIALILILNIFILQLQALKSRHGQTCTIRLLVQDWLRSPTHNWSQFSMSCYKKWTLSTSCGLRSIQEWLPTLPSSRWVFGHIMSVASVTVLVDNSRWLSYSFHENSEV